MMRKNRFLSCFLLLLLLLLISLSFGLIENEEEAEGMDHFEEGTLLFEDGFFEDAAMEFWKAVIKHGDTTDYKAGDAFQNFLMCYHNQGKLALGYLFVAAQMYRAGDNRSLEYLRMAHNLEPDHPEVLALMEYMGESNDTIESKLRYHDEEDDSLSRNDDNQELPESCNHSKDCTREVALQEFEYGFLECGWDDKTWSRYQQVKSRLLSTPEIAVTIPPLSELKVAYHKFWFGVAEWETSTFEIFQKYIDSDTIVIDIGTWIGPTLLFHAQLSKRSYGVEADPMAFGEVRTNIKLNKHLEAKIVMEPVAVTSPRDAGELVMKSSKLGNSETFLGNKQDAESFEVRGYTLPFIMAKWGLQLPYDSIFIKIDIESYECRLVPSFYEWLDGEPQWDLTIFVSFHPQVQACTKTQMEGVLQTFQLFDRVTCNEDKHVLPISAQTTFDEFETMIESIDCLTGHHNSDFLLSGKRE